MAVSLPPELIHLILFHLCGTPSIAECALVSHSWLPSARYHLWPPNKVLDLNRIQIAEFLRLLDSPGSTLSLLSFSTLHLSQWRPRLPGVVDSEDDPWSDTTVQDLLARNLSFPSITTLSLDHISCRTLSQPALTSLHNHYQSVKTLELRYIRFTSPELCSIIAALTGLEKITFGGGVACQSDPSTVDSVRITHSRLRNLAFTEIPPFSTIRFLTRTIRYTTGIVTVDIKLPIPPGHKHPTFKACGQLLETAGMNLRVFEFQPFYCMPSLDHNASDAISFAELIGFPRNPNLQEIEIKRPGFKETAVILLMEGLKTNAKHSLRRLKLGLGVLSGWEKWTKTWLLVDETLSRMSLKDPKLIIDLPPLESPSPYREWEGFDPERKKALEKAYFEESSEKVKSWLPRTAGCWELEIVASTF